MASNIVINIGAKDAASKVIAGVGKNVAKLGKTVDAVGVKFTQVGKSIAGIGLKIGAIGLAGAASFAPLIAAGSDLQETMGKFDVVFGENAETMTDWSKTTAAALGTSRVEMAKMLSGMQDLLVPVGVMPEKATDMSKTLATLAVDLGSFNNMDTANVFRDLQAAITGSSETMKKYGVVSNEAAVKQELLNQGLDPKSATNAEKAIARLNIILASTTAAQGDAIRTASGAANQWKRFKSTVLDVAGVVGSTLLPAVESVLSVVNDAAQGVRRFVDQNPALVSAILGVGVAATAAAVTIGIASVSIGVSLTLVGTAISGVSAAITTLGIVAGVVFTPFGIAIAAMVGPAVQLGAVFLVIATSSGIAGDAVKELTRVFKGLLPVVDQTVQGVTDAITNGDWESAGKIGMLGLKVAMLKGLEDIGIAIASSATDWLRMLGEFFIEAVKGAGRMALEITKYMTNPLYRLKGIDLKKIFDFGEINIAAGIRDARKAAQDELNLLTGPAWAARIGKNVSDGLKAGLTTGMAAFGKAALQLGFGAGNKGGKGFVDGLVNRIGDGLGQGGDIASGLIGKAGAFFNNVDDAMAGGFAAGVFDKVRQAADANVKDSTGGRGPNSATQSRLMTGGGAETTQKQILNVSKKQAEFQKNTAKLLKDLLGFFENKPPEPVVKLVPVN